MNAQDFNLETWQVILLAVAAVWELVWKGFALWRAARNDQPVWFVLILILNTIGILPIIYLFVTKDRSKSTGTQQRIDVSAA